MANIGNRGNGPAQDPLTVVQGLLAALNAGDLDGMLAFIADDATIRYEPPAFGPPNGRYTGKAEVRVAYGNLIAGKGQFTPTAPLRVSGDTVSGRVRQAGAGIRALGFDFIEADLSYTVRDGLIVASIVAFTQETIDAGFPGVSAPWPGLANAGDGGVARTVA